MSVLYLLYGRINKMPPLPQTPGVEPPDWGGLGIHLWTTIKEIEAFNCAIDQFWQQRHAYVNQFINK